MKPAEKYRAWKAHRPEKPIFRTILFSMMAVLLAEVILLSTGIGLTNVSGRLNQNAKQIVNIDRKSTRLNSSHIPLSRMPSSA